MIVALVILVLVLGFATGNLLVAQYYLKRTQRILEELQWRR